MRLSELQRIVILMEIPTTLEAVVTLSNQAQTPPLSTLALANQSTARVASALGVRLTSTDRSSLLPLPRLAEVALIAALQQGEPKAFAQLYDRYSGALHHIVLCIVREKPLAEDVLQESFVKIWQRFPDFDASKERLFTWLLNVTRNTAISHLRSRQWQLGLRLLSHSPERPLCALIAHSHQPDLLGISDLLIHLRAAERRVVELIYLQGHTAVEAATVLVLPLGTVKTRLRSALGKLKRMLVMENQLCIPLASSQPIRAGTVHLAANVNGHSCASAAE